MTELDEPQRLENLPAEVRNRIFRYAVVRDEPYDLSTKESRAEVVGPALSLVNKSIRREVIPVFYGRNLFVTKLQPSFREKDNLCDIISEWAVRRRNYTKFIRKVAAFEKCEGAEQRALHVSIGAKQDLTIKFEGISKVASRCICQIVYAKTISHENGASKVLPGCLLFVCNGALQSTLSYEHIDKRCTACMERIAKDGFESGITTLPGISAGIGDGS